MHREVFAELVRREPAGSLPFPLEPFGQHLLHRREHALALVRFIDLSDAYGDSLARCKMSSA